jgi:hypothetical protein
MGSIKVRIVWNGQGGELDSVTVVHDGNDDYAVANALIKLVRGSIVTPGDSFVVEEVS